MYKDKDKQKEAVKKATQRYRAKNADSALPDHRSGLENARGLAVVDGLGITNLVILPKRATQPVIPERTAQGNIRVSKPGDDDYVPQCETTRAFIEGRDKRPETAKRGKDIKSFEDLPPDVQETIHKLSTIDGKICPTVKANRTAIAINYQHLFPDRYNATGVA